MTRDYSRRDKLMPARRLQLRSAFMFGSRPMKELAKMFGVDQSTVHRSTIGKGLCRPPGPLDYTLLRHLWDEETGGRGAMSPDQFFGLVLGSLEGADQRTFADFVKAANRTMREDKECTNAALTHDFLIAAALKERQSKRSSGDQKIKPMPKSDLTRQEERHPLASPSGPDDQGGAIT